MGITKTLAKAKRFFYWPGINSYIEIFIKTCRVRQKFSRSKRKEPILNHEIPKTPFTKIAMDLAEHCGKIYLIVFNFYWRQLEITKLREKSAESILTEQKVIFSKFGIPEQTFTDNNPFNSIAFKKFAKEWGFDIVTSSPNYP